MSTVFKKHGLCGRIGNNWKGGRRLDTQGYVRLRCEDHPRASKHGHYVREHILIMEKHIGRYLDYPTEEVHHINGNKQDNRIENLQLLTISEHRSLEKRIYPIGTKCSICYSITQLSRSKLSGKPLCHKCYKKEYYRLHKGVAAS
jgi:hypothetical protein